MAFNPEKITKEDVYDAVETIVRDNLDLHPSSGYDVIINDRPYPPKEVIRIAYRLATGHDAGIIYGGDPVNKILRKLGFTVEPKIRFWKLGCNWERGNPSFFDLIKENSIVITVQDFPYKEGDMILVTEGFTVYAIAKITSELYPITTRPELKEAFEERKIPFEDWLLYAQVEWFDLTDSQIFTYKLQAGIRRVHKQEIINNVLDIWDSRLAKLHTIQFYLKGYNSGTNPEWKYPCMVLVPNSWDDYGYKTCFDLFYYKDPSARDSIEVVKILQKKGNITKLPKEFEQLPDNYCSLGQTLSYYKRLRSDFPYEYMVIARALNDCVLYPEIRREFEQLEGFQVSLLRSSEAQKAISESIDLIQIGQPDQIRPFVFDFEFQVQGAAMPHKVDFKFNDDPDLQNRFFCLIGKNGTGKTRILAQLAKKLSNNLEDGSFSPERPLFSRIIAVSFSLFDKFQIPKTEDISYELISFKDAKGVLNEEEISNKLWRSYKAIMKSRIRKNIWLNCIRISLELDYLEFKTDELETLASRQEFSEKLDDIFSSGQKITFHFFTRLISCIEKNSIIIFDEPETHLHPNVVGRLLKALHYVLKNFNSFCIMATHSPVIVQEIPSRFIRIIERQKDLPIIFQPAIECFGENLTNINNAIFHVDEEKELYKTSLEDLALEHNIQNINEIFKNQLSLNAKLYLQTIIKNNK